jgi:3-keto-disaccharide hydrolase
LPLVARSLLVVTAAMTAACSNTSPIDARECVNKLTEQEQSSGWQLLFDGTDLKHWRSYQEQHVNKSWEIENGCLTTTGWGGDLISRQQFADFELKLDWRISASGNSGIFIRGDESGKTIHHTGFEMQVIDNAGHRDASNPSHRAGAYYDMIAPPEDSSLPALEWNAVHIIARGPHIEFWLNGRQSAKFELASPEWQALYGASKFIDRPDYGTLLRGHIGFQGHWNTVWFRNVRVLELASGDK